MTSDPDLSLFNQLTTNDDYSCHAALATYLLAQSILKIISALAERVGQRAVDGCHPLSDSAWWLLQLAGYRKVLVSTG